MNQLCTMKVLQRFENLIKDINLMHFLQDIGPNNRMQICLHKLKYQVQVLFIFGLDDSVKLDNIFVIKLFEYGNFSIGSLRVNRITKCVEHFLQSIPFVSAFLLNLPDVPVGTATHLFLQNVLV